MTVSDKTNVFGSFSLKSIHRRAAAIVFCLTMIFGAQMANAATFTVSNNNDSGAGSFRDAINSANSDSTLDTILFSSDVTTITPTTPLPVITQPVIIDGSLNGQQAATPRVELSGAMTASSPAATTNDQFGLQIAPTAAGSTIRGLIINRFGNAGIKTAGNTTTILQNIIGTNLGGMQALGNVNQGILIVGSTGNVIGGANALDRNVISGNQGSGIAVTRGGAATIINNYIGVGGNGATDLGNTNDGILIADSSNSIIGGITAAERNVISGNNGNGVYIAQNAAAIPASGNVVQGNYIGVNAAGAGDGTTGNSTVGNDGSGVVIQAGGNTVGGNTTGARNIISGNRSNGVSLSTNFATANKVSANFIGVSANFTGVASDTTTIVRNRLNGVQISNLASNNKVGGTDTGVGVCDNSCNVIANNGDVNANTGRAGIYLDSSAGTGNSFQRNSIFSNTELGIDLAVPSSSTDTAFIPGTGTTPNDPGDPDTGPNDLQNFPVINSANTAGVIGGTLNSTANTTFAIDFYSDTAADGAMSEGRTYLGTTSVMTDPMGNALFSYNAGATALTAGQFVTATATSTAGAAQALGDTSEFSAPRTVINAPTAGAGGFEGDVAARPNGDGVIRANDENQVTRFLNELDTPSTVPNEFQRADTAPYDPTGANSGDGFIRANDVNQVIRYLNELDPLQPANGPVMKSGTFQSPALGAPARSKTSKTREVISAPQVAPALKVQSRNGSPGNPVTVPILVDAVGNESGYAFAVTFDPNVLTFTGFANGDTGATTFSCNTTMTAGRIRCNVSAFPNNQPGSNPAIKEIGAGDNQVLIRVIFTVAAGAASNTTTPVNLPQADASATTENSADITPTTTGGVVAINGPTAAAVTVKGRVTARNRGIAGARVSMTDASGATRYATTNTFGYYQFANVPAGETYVFKVRAKRYEFPTRVVDVNEGLDGLDFAGSSGR